METCPECGSEIVALPEDAEKLGSDWLELSKQATEINGRLKLLRAKIVAIAEHANARNLNGPGWRMAKINTPSNSLMRTRLVSKGVEADTIKYATESTSEAKRQRLEDKGVSPDILDYAFSSPNDSEPTSWKLARTK